jgi:PAS domain S-box-containing protein
MSACGTIGIGGCHFKIPHRVLYKPRNSDRHNTPVMETLAMVTSEQKEKRAVKVKPATSKASPYEDTVRDESGRYGTLVNDLPLLICTFLPSGEITFVNQNYCRYFDRSFSDLVGSNFLTLIPAEDRQSVKDNISALTMNAPVQTHEHKVVAPAGAIRYHRWTNRAIFDETGSLCEYQSIGEDITAYRRANEALRESEMLHRIILNNILDAVFITDNDGRFIYVCPNVSVIFGYHFEDVLALGNIEKLLGADLFDPQTLAVSKELHNIERSVRDKSGHTRIILVNVKQVSIKEGTRLYTCHEITELKKAEADLRKQKEYLNTLLETIPNPVFYKDIEGKYSGCNRAFEAFVGKPRSAVIGKTVYDLGPTQIADRYHEMDKVLFQHPGKQHYEWQVQAADGSLRDVIFDKATIEDAAGNIVGLVGVISDITERIESERALRKSESTLKAILAASPIGICLVRDRIIRWTNHAIYRIWGHAEGGLEGSDTRLLYPDDEEYERIGNEFYTEILEEGIGKIETVWIKRNGAQIHCYLQGCFLDASDPARGVIVAVMDISDRKKAEDLVRDLSHMLIKAQENERKMISYELHDSIAQNLSYLKIDCDTFFDERPGMPEVLVDRMRHHSNLIMQTIKAVRELSYGLHPPSLEELGLEQTLMELCDELSDHTGLEVDYIPTGLGSLKPDPLFEINIYRLIQEGFNNIRKHAQATHAKLAIVASHANVTLRIEDNGIGFEDKDKDGTTSAKQGMGLRNMTERVNLLHGKIKIKSKPGWGTKVIVRIPVSTGERRDD